MNRVDPSGKIDPTILQNAGAGVPVVLPDGSRIPSNGYGNTPYVMSPVPDLSDVAAAGRATGSVYSTLLNNPDTSGTALPYLLYQLRRDLRQAGTFDYQRSYCKGKYTQYSQFRNVSNVNVGLYGQQAGLTPDEVLTYAGLYASVMSSNANPNAPYGLDTQTRYFIEVGYRIGASGVFKPR